MLRFHSRTMIAAVLCAGIAPALGFAQANSTTTVTATALKMGGVPIANGTVTITPINSKGTAIGVGTADGAFSAADPRGYQATITNGAIAPGFVVPDQATAIADTANTPISYQVTIQRAAMVSRCVGRQLQLRHPIHQHHTHHWHYVRARRLPSHPDHTHRSRRLRQWTGGQRAKQPAPAPSEYYTYTPSLQPSTGRYECIAGLFRCSTTPVAAAGGTNGTNGVERYKRPQTATKRHQRRWLWWHIHQPPHRLQLVPPPSPPRLAWHTSLARACVSHPRPHPPATWKASSPPTIPATPRSRSRQTQPPAPAPSPPGICRSPAHLAQTARAAAAALAPFPCTPTPRSRPPARPPESWRTRPTRLPDLSALSAAAR